MLHRLRLSTNAVMTENLAMSSTSGTARVDRRSEGGYRRVFMEKSLQG